MTDHDPLDHLLQDAARRWRTTDDIPREAIWQGIAAELDAVPRAARRGIRPGWGLLTAAVAASLLLGVVIGRVGRDGAPPAVAGSDASAQRALPADAYQRATEELLGQTAVLLVALPTDETPATSSAQLARQGVELLQSTRLLLDSPVAADARMRALLEDLELVLAQVAGLQPRPAEELTLIHDAVTQRDLLPRLRSAVVATSSLMN